MPDQSSEMKLVVGLGNPGPQYAGTRHNVGFLVFEELARRLGARELRRAHQAELAEATAHGQRVLLAKPQTMMNLSGQSVSGIMRYYKLPLESLVVVYDDLDLAFSRIRLRPGGSAGGHNGMRSLIACLGSQEFARVRVGIGRPTGGGGISYVLGRWTAEERAALSTAVGEAADAVETILTAGLQQAMNQHNTRSDA